MAFALESHARPFALRTRRRSAISSDRRCFSSSKTMKDKFSVNSSLFVIDSSYAPTNCGTDFIIVMCNYHVVFRTVLLLLHTDDIITRELLVAFQQCSTALVRLDDLGELLHLGFGDHGFFFTMEKVLWELFIIPNLPNMAQQYLRVRQIHIPEMIRDSPWNVGGQRTEF